VHQKKPTKHYTDDASSYKSINNSDPKTKITGGPSQTISFRLPRNILYKLQQEAKQKEISVDTLMTQIAEKHTEWYVNASEIGFISVRKILIMTARRNKRRSKDKGDSKRSSQRVQRLFAFAKREI
jgi:hypothetical protein